MAHFTLNLQGGGLYIHPVNEQLNDPTLGRHFDEPSMTPSLRLSEASHIVFQMKFYCFTMKSEIQ